MQEEEFKSKREFNRKFPSKMFICSNCEELTFDKYTCLKCGWRADGLFKTMGKGYKYTLTKENFTEEIFKPIELLQEPERKAENGNQKRTEATN